jgi:hypothetical protein
MKLSLNAMEFLVVNLYALHIAVCNTLLLHVSMLSTHSAISDSVRKKQECRMCGADPVYKVSRNRRQISTVVNSTQGNSYEGFWRGPGPPICSEGRSLKQHGQGHLR